MLEVVVVVWEWLVQQFVMDSVFVQFISTLMVGSVYVMQFMLL